MLLKSDCLCRLFGLISDLQLNTLGRSGAECCLTDLSLSELARQVMIVQTGFADRDHFRMSRQFLKFRQEILALFGHGVRVNADDGIYFGMMFGEFYRLATRLQRCANCNDTPDASLFGSVQNGIEIVGKLRKIQVCVRVNEHLSLESPLYHGAG